MTAYLRVAEPTIATNADGWQFWVEWRTAHRPDRFSLVYATIAGEVVDVECDGREHAAWLADYLASRGVPKRAMRVVHR